MAPLDRAVNIRYTKKMDERSRIVTAASPQKRGRGRPNDYPEVIMIRAPAGTRARLTAVAAASGERQADVIRAAIAREIARRRK